MEGDGWPICSTAFPTPANAPTDYDNLGLATALASISIPQATAPNTAPECTLANMGATHG